MLMQEVFKHLRGTPTNKLQSFSPNESLKPQKTSVSAKKYEQGYFQYFKDIVDEFVCNFSMHGLNRIFERNLSRYKRITWIIGFALCLMVLIFVGWQLTYRYHHKPLITVVSATHYPVFQIPFPEVTVCNKNRFNWQRFNMAKQLFLKTEHQRSPEYQNIFQEVLNAYDTLTFGEFFKFENLTKASAAMLNNLNYVNFSRVSEFMAWRCHEIFSVCIWLEKHYDCCELFFSRNSQMGSCLAFNTLESAGGLEKQKSDPFWPWRSKGQGIDYGLSVRVHLREHEHSPMSSPQNKKGILVMLSEPDVWFNDPIEINTHTQTSISFTATLHNFENYTRIFSARIRQCLFEDEQNSKYYKSLPNRRYMFENCMAQCQQEHLVKFCNCTFGLFYPSGPYKHCRLVDYPCLFYNNDKFRYLKQISANNYAAEKSSDVMKCNCFSNCKSLTYKPKVTTAYMNHMTVVFNNSYIDLSLFYQQEFIVVYLTTVLYKWLDLMVSFGGLAGLCIGCSFLSLVELAYFFVVDIPRKSIVYYKLNKRLRFRKKSYKIKVDIMENI